MVLFLCLANAAVAQTTGRVVINEYMPRTSNACGVTSEFVELLNFGPGPVNISCYILTTGVYSVTIPPNTILQPGRFYVLAGQNSIPGNCANVDGNPVTANLNWNTCNCTNQPIPTSNSSEGMMADDGYSPMVLLDPSLNVIDAVIRNLPGAATGPVTSSSVNGSCSAKTFTLGNMGINYEILGMAPGNQNSFARTRDGDCVWVKETQESGGATNNRTGRTSDIAYDFIPVNLTDCGENQGTISIFVKHANYASIFPMNYTIVRDSNNNGVFDFGDAYTTETVYEPPFIEIENLPVGRYIITVASSKGCYLETFGPFTITTCNPGTLPVRLAGFKNTGTRNGQHHLEWLLREVQNLQSIVVEKGTSDGRFVTETILSNEMFRGDKLYTYAATASPAFPLYRLKVTSKNGRSFYSPVINVASGTEPPPVRISPNPATTDLRIQFTGRHLQKAAYTIYNSNGLAVKAGHLPLPDSENKASISLQSLMPGTYHLQLTGLSGQLQPISFRFVKH